MALLKDLWGPIEEVTEAETERVLGSLTLRMRRVPSELWVSEVHAEARTTDVDAWTRWAIAPADHLELRPALPDRPVVVSTEQPFFLPPETEARVFVRVPLVARLVRTADGKEEAILSEFPSVVLSDTWWGTFTEGELAYWVTTRARRAVSPETHEPHMAICPLLLMNGSDAPLPVERFVVRVSYLTLFGKADALWTDEVMVRYEGAQEGSEIRYTGEVPEAAGDVREVAVPREPPPRGLHARTFGRLRALSGLD